MNSITVGSAVGKPKRDERMPHFEPVVFAIAIVALVVALTALARRLPVPTPILQLIAGFLVGLLPGIAIPDFNPDLLFSVFPQDSRTYEPLAMLGATRTAL